MEKTALKRKSMRTRNQQNLIMLRIAFSIRSAVNPPNEARVRTQGQTGEPKGSSTQKLSDFLKAKVQDALATNGEVVIVVTVEDTASKEADIIMADVVATTPEDTMVDTGTTEATTTTTTGITEAEEVIEEDIVNNNHNSRNRNRLLSREVG